MNCSDFTIYDGEWGDFSKRHRVFLFGWWMFMFQPASSPQSAPVNIIPINWCRSAPQWTTDRGGWACRKATPRSSVQWQGYVGLVCKWEYHEFLFWLVVWNMKFMTFNILGISSPQLTFTPSFFRGVGWNQQPVFDVEYNDSTWFDHFTKWIFHANHYQGHHGGLE